MRTNKNLLPQEFVKMLYKKPVTIALHLKELMILLKEVKYNFIEQNYQNYYPCIY